MANECTFKMHVKGEFESINHFYNGLIHNGPIWIGRGIFASYTNDPDDLMIKFNRFNNCAIIEGAVKWSLISSLIDWDKSEFSEELLDKNPDMEYFTLFDACEKFNVNIEVYSREEMMGFEEHIKYEDKNIINESVNYQAIYDDNEQLIKTEGGYGDWEFSDLKMPENKDNKEIEKFLKDESKNLLITKKNWDDFRDAGLLWFTNTILNAFGWSIAIEKDVNNNIIKEVYPARVKFRGFPEDSNTRGYKKLTEYLLNNINELAEEVKKE